MDPIAIVTNKYHSFLLRLWDEVEENSRVFVWNLFNQLRIMSENNQLKNQLYLKMVKLANQRIWDKKTFLLCATSGLGNLFFQQCLELREKTGKNFAVLAYQQPGKSFHLCFKFNFNFFLF